MNNDNFGWSALQLHPSVFNFQYFNSLSEVISTSPADSRVIQNYSADRIELVSALQIGGITPSKALLRKSLQISDIKTMVMVRHHNQGFVLQQSEKQLLVEQAVQLVEMGSKGIVIGAITEDKKIDEQFLQMLSKEISFNKVDVTFHKASDYTTNLIQAYQTLTKYNVNRVLTQGGTKKVEENTQILQQLLANGKIKTLIGGGVSLSNIDWLIKTLKPSQVHIGTCVRKDKYGPVQGVLIEQFIKAMSKA